MLSIKLDFVADTCLRGRFDSSVGRGDFKTPIGVGRVIRGKPSAVHCCDKHLPQKHATSLGFLVAKRTIGWDEGVLSVDGGMTLGEKATLTITG